MKDQATITKKPAKKQPMGAQVIRASVNWQLYGKKFEKTGREQLIDQITGSLLQRTTGVNKSVLERYADADSREAFIRSVTIHLMSTPEYQLC
jgi:uncharacterized protein YutE (UPF0331/DUF86 family)